jgi:hypothetical protein
MQQLVRRSQRAAARTKQASQSVEQTNWIEIVMAWIKEKQKEACRGRDGQSGGH